MGERVREIGKFEEVVGKMLGARERGEEIGGIIEGFEAEGYEINKDKRYVEGILDGIKKKEGYCPCQVGKAEGAKCPCEHFEYMGHCCCKMFLKKEQKEV